MLLAVDSARDRCCGLSAVERRLVRHEWRLARPGRMTRRGVLSPGGRGAGVASEGEPTPRPVRWGGLCTDWHDTGDDAREGESRSLTSETRQGPVTARQGTVNADVRDPPARIDRWCAPLVCADRRTRGRPDVRRRDRHGRPGLHPPDGRVLRDRRPRRPSLRRQGRVVSAADWVALAVSVVVLGYLFTVLLRAGRGR